MTIAFSLLFERKSWSFPVDPASGLPAGIWSATGEDEGDASGGSVTWQHIFSSPANGLGDSNYYSIEQFMFGTGINGSVGCSLTLNGMDRQSGRVAQPDVPINRVYQFVLADIDANVSHAAGIFLRAVPSNLINPHIWVGTYQGLPTDFGDVLVRARNPSATAFSTCAIHGYWWTPDAINSRLGMRRPPEYVFSP